MSMAARRVTDSEVKLERLRDIYRAEGWPSNAFAFALWCAELPVEEEQRILAALEAAGWILQNGWPLPEDRDSAFWHRVALMWKLYREWNRYGRYGAGPSRADLKREGLSCAVVATEPAATAAPSLGGERRNGSEGAPREGSDPPCPVHLADAGSKEPAELERT